MEAIPFALNAYGLPHTMGFLATRSGAPAAAPLDVFGLMDRAVALGLIGVDTPLPESVPAEALREGLEARGLRLVVESMALLATDLAGNRAILEKAAASGATVVRFVLSGILCGDRRGFPGGWAAHREALSARLRALLPIAAGIGVSIALENHQDATTEDFLTLYEKSGAHPAFGVCLDTGNPLAVGEDPVEAARRLAPLIRHLHLKDYTIHHAPEGYRLVRCVAGQGVVDFARILELVLAHGRDDLLPGIEIAAQATRTIPLLEPTWWAEYPPRDARTLLGPLRILWEQGYPQDAPYSSAWERGEGSESVVEEEWRVVSESAAYFRRLWSRLD